MDSASPLEAPTLGPDRDAQSDAGHLLFFVPKLADFDGTERVRGRNTRPPAAA
jgi:hypothetical protein